MKLLDFDLVQLVFWEDYGVLVKKGNEYDIKPLASARSLYFFCLQSNTNSPRAAVSRSQGRAVLARFIISITYCHAELLARKEY